MSDHKGQAQNWLEMADQHSDWFVEAPKQTVERYLFAAQAEATLYLAEQQRIANLIAYWQLHTPRSVEESFTEPGQIEVKQIHDNEGYGVDGQIREGLGIA